MRGSQRGDGWGQNSSRSPALALGFWGHEPAWEGWRRDRRLKEGTETEGSICVARRLSPSPTTGEGARLRRRRKPNSPAGNFPPSRGSSCAPPAPSATGPGPAHRARGRGGGALS